uniref:Uncharacterized protein n=1 Tax=Utricularia reniformis TaxID=192314 RepID=A0A1Y0B4T8_9LAMI|nr:hypothetical protein AEK19_MT2203 [Utricularia reniformis]ART32349.1 hypothetical protein AEK19_MT2203 [Utricularia reniformis]
MRTYKAGTLYCSCQVTREPKEVHTDASDYVIGGMLVQ